MSLDKKLFKAVATTTTTADAAQGLVLHLDANDEDSIEQGGANDGNTNGTWFDIANHDLNVPLVDKASNLQLHLNASDTTSYSGSGNTWTDISGNTRHGAITGATFDSDIRGYFQFDGSANDFVKISDTALVQSNGTNFTVEAWVRRTQTGTLDYIASQSTDDGNSQNWLLRFNNNNTLAWYIYGSNNYMTTSSTYSANVWYHVVALVESDGTSRIYVDGTLVTSSSSGQSAKTSSYNTFIGNLGDGSNATTGDADIALVRIYNVALTASEVGQNYRAGNFFDYDSIYSTDLVTNLDAANYTSGTWADSAGSNNGTVNGASFDKELGNFFNFDGSNDTITVSATDTAPINFSSETHAIAFWVNFNNLTNDDVVLGKFGGSNTTKSFQIQVSNSNKLTVLERDGGSNHTFETTGTFSTGTWAHFTYVRSASQVILYINGALDSTHSASNAINAGSTQDITIGNQASASVYFDGKLGQVKIYSATLTAAQVAQNYLAKKNDYPNGNHATNNGATFTYSSTPYYFDFGGSSDYFTTNLIKNWASVPWSVEVWFNSDVRADDYLWGITDSSGYGVSVSLRGSGNGYNIFLIGVGNLSAGVYNSGQWYQLVYTSDGTTRKAYLNGSFVNSGTAGIDSRANGKPFTIGRYGNYSAGYYDGKVGLVRVFDKELTASEVTANFDADKATYGLS